MIFYFNIDLIRDLLLFRHLLNLIFEFVSDFELRIWVAGKARLKFIVEKFNDEGLSELEGQVFYEKK